MLQQKRYCWPKRLRCVEKLGDMAERVLLALPATLNPKTLRSKKNLSAAFLCVPGLYSELTKESRHLRYLSVSSKLDGNHQSKVKTRHSHCTKQTRIEQKNETKKNQRMLSTFAPNKLLTTDTP